MIGVKKMKLTIFTPTYNRKEFLEGLYESIVSSFENCSSRDTIEWLIVDDGSTSDIESIVREFSKSSSFPIVFKRKRNGGKHTAFNCAIKEASGELFVCIDDDDRLTENALKDIFIIARKYENTKYVGYVGRVVDENNCLLGKTLKTPFESNTIEVRDKLGYWGEPEVFLTKELKNYSFAEIENEKFLTEAYVFDVMSKGNRFIYENVPLMVKKFYAGGLTDNQLKIRIESPKGCYLYYKQRYALTKGIFFKIKTRLNKLRFGLWITDKEFKENNKRDIADYLFLIPAYFIYMKDKNYYHNL